jgi:elongation factor G
MKTRLGAKPLVIQLPLGAESDFLGLIDLLEMKQLRWKDESLGAEFVVEDINDALLDEAKKWREQMIELAVEQDDAAMEEYLDGNEPNIETLKKCIRKGTLSSSFVPVLCGSAFKNKGVQPMLDAVIDFLPSPEDLPPVKGINPSDDSEMNRELSDDVPFSALAFKIMNDPFVGS